MSGYARWAGTPAFFSLWSGEARRPRTWSSRLLAGLTIALLLWLCWLATYAVGGAGKVAPHWFYVPILLAASRFGFPGAAVAALASGILAGPLMPLDVRAGTFQEASDWGSRMIFFLGIGLVMSGVIAGRRRAERRLRQADLKYRTLVEQLPAITYIAEFGESGRWVYVSPQIETVLGFSPGQWLADPNIWFRQVHPADRERVQAEEARSRATGEPLRSEYRMLTSDGGLVSVRDEATVIRDDEGQAIYLQGVMLDVTRRKEAEAALERVSRLHRLILESAGEGIYGVDRRGKLTFVNQPAARTLGWEADDLVGRSAHETVHHSRADGSPYPVEECPIHASLREGTARRVADEVVWRKDGSPVPVEYVNTPILEDGEVVGSVVVFRDVTERRAREKELRRTLEALSRADEERRRLLSHLVAAQEEERRRIAADVHDDSIQVMTATLMRLEMLRRLADPAEDRSLERLEESVRQAVGRLRRLVFDLAPPSLAAEGLVAALEHYLDKALEGTGVAHEVRSRLEAEPSMDVRTIAYRIAQEAVTNVVKHAGATRVDVGVESSDGGLLIRVTDDGVGFSTNGAEEPKAGHLGLVNMRERARSAGGWCRIQSLRGKGTAVAFWLPSEGWLPATEDLHGSLQSADR